MFNTPTQIGLSVDERNRRSVLELTAGDRPGLLCEVGKVLMAERIELHAAKIMTVGERAEDVFYLTDFDNQPLTSAAAERLKEHLVQALDERQAALRQPARGRCRHEPAPGGAARLPVRAPGAPEGRHRPAARTRSHIAMSIGEPQHAPPAFVLEALRRSCGRARQLPDDRRPAATARGVRRRG